MKGSLRFIITLLICLSAQHSFSAEKTLADSLDMDISNQKSKYQNYSDEFTVNIYTGIYTPFGLRNTFGTRPVFGASLGSEYRRFTYELCGKVRANINDNDFAFFAMDSLYNVDSKASIYLGGIAGYKIIDNNDICVTPNVGVGFESIATGLSETNEDDEIVKYNNLNTATFTAGVSVLRTIFYNYKVGVNFSYNYTPYHLKDNLHTTIKNHSLAIEAVFQF